MGFFKPPALAVGFLTVYRLNQEPIVLQDNDKLTLPELLPGWELVVSELWPPVFE